MGKLRTEQEISHWTGELRAGPLYPPPPLQQPPYPVFSITSCFGPEKGIEASP